MKLTVQEMMSMKEHTIGFLIPSFEIFGGLEKIALELANLLISYFKNIVIFTECLPEVQIRAQYSSHLIYEQINLFPANISKFNQLMLDYQVSVLIYHGLYNNANSFLAKWRNSSSIPLVSELHNKPLIAIPKKNQLNRQNLKGIIKSIFYPLYIKYYRNSYACTLKRIVSASDVVVLLSNSYIPLLKEQLGEISNNIKIVAIPNFIEPCYPSNSSNKRNRLLYIGRIEENQKRFSRVINIWKQIADKYPKWYLDVVGTGSDLEKWEKFCRDENIERIYFHGFKKDVTQFYESANIVLLTSDYEGFPLSICEGITHNSTPLLYNSFDAIRDIIPPDANYLLVEPFNEAEYINRLECLMTDTSKGAYFNNLLKKNIVQFYPENIILQWLKLIKNILDEKNNAGIRDTSRGNKNGSAGKGVPETPQGV